MQRNPSQRPLSPGLQRDLDRVATITRKVAGKLPYRLRRALECFGAETPWSRVGCAADCIGTALNASERRLIERAGDRLEAAGIDTERLGRELGFVVRRHREVEDAARAARAEVDGVFEARDAGECLGDCYREHEPGEFRRCHFEQLEGIAGAFADYLRSVARKLQP
jgi:hypothetical protein